MTLFHDLIHKRDISLCRRYDCQIRSSGLRKFRLCLNPTKFTFGARSGKLMGFIVSQRGIEVDNDKVRRHQA